MTPVALIPLSAVRELLSCPACRRPLEAGPTYRCGNPDCSLETFRVVGGRWPVLVDGSASVLDPAAVSDPGPSGGTRRSRRSRLLEPVRRLVRPRNEVAARQLAQLKELIRPGGLVLVVGGGSVGNGADRLYDDPDLRVLAFDIFADERVQLVADAHAIPLADGTVDGVVIQAVLEHVLDPAAVVAEIHRVLRPEGVVYAETPFMQQVHAGAYDFTRFSDSGHRWLFRRFTEIDRGVVAGPGTSLSWSIDHLVRSLTRSRAAGRIARLAFFWVRFADRLADPRFAADGASAVYFLGRRAERSITPAEAIRGYAGAQVPPSTVAGTAGGDAPTAR